MGGPGSFRALQESELGFDIFREVLGTGIQEDEGLGLRSQSFWVEDAGV